MQKSQVQPFQNGRSTHDSDKSYVLYYSDDDDVIMITSYSSSFSSEELPQANTENGTNSPADRASALVTRKTGAAVVLQDPNQLEQPWHILVKNAVENGNLEELRSLQKNDPAYQDLYLLFRAGNKIQRKDPSFLICRAAQKRNIDMMRSLLLMGFDKSTKDCDGKTALHYAIENEDIDMVKELLYNNYGFITHVSMVYRYFSTGDTYLHVAARQGNREIVKILIDYCSDRNNFNYGLEASELHVSLDRTELNKVKQKAADVAYQCGHTHLVELLGGRTPSSFDCCSCAIQ